MGCCALVSLFERDVCLAGTAAVVDMLVGEEETQGSGCPSSRLPASLCAHLAVARGAAAKCSTPHTKGRSALLGATAPPPRSGMCQVHTRWTRARIPHYYHCQRQETRAWCNLKPTTDTKLFSRLQKLEAMDATTFTERLF